MDCRGRGPCLPAHVRRRTAAACRPAPRLQSAWGPARHISSLLEVSNAHCKGLRGQSACLAAGRSDAWALPPSGRRPPRTTGGDHDHRCPIPSCNYLGSRSNE